MPAEPAVPPSSGTSVALRVVVTAAAVALFVVGRWLPLPLVDEDAYLMFRGDWQARGTLSPLSLGLNPFLAAFLLVEVVALVHPEWRRLRHGSVRGRRALTRAAWTVALLFAAWQGYGVVVLLQQMRGMLGDPVLGLGLAPALGVTAAIVAGTLATGLAAVLVSRRGLGNGFAVLFAVTVLLELAQALWNLAAQAREEWGEAPLLAAVALAVVGPLVLGRWRREAAAGPRLPFPTCGLAVAQAPSAVLGFVAALALWIPAVEPVYAALRADSWLLAGLDVVLVVALAVVFARLFCPPDAVVTAFRRAAPGRGDDADAAVRAALRVANRRSILLVVGVALLPVVAGLLGAPVYLHVSLILALAILAALVRDLGGEADARRCGGDLVTALPLHRVYAVAPALEALAAAGIPAFPRALHYRALFHFFAPWAPVDILVPAGHAPEAEEICARVVAGDPAPEAAATAAGSPVPG